MQEEGTPCRDFIDFRLIVKTLIEGGEGHVWSEGWVWDELHNGRFARTFLNSLPLSVLGTCLYLVSILIHISFNSIRILIARGDITGNLFIGAM